MSNHETLSASIYASLRRAILEQALKPGQKLAEEAIAEIFGVSRTGVRSALILLSADGLVDIRPNRGAAVSEPAADEAEDVFSVRRALEAEVIRKLCARMGKDGIDALEAHLREEERALRSGSTALSIRLAGEFHVLMAELTNSPTLARMVNHVCSRSSLILAQFARAHSAECGIDEHREVIAALKEQDAEAAIALMNAHIAAVEERARSDQPEAEADVTAILRRYAAAAG